ncbi:hypothetical protein MTP99_012607 [Tenebrio molitor]|nr:hypothetical protein MTP99_012607 [Tenebrio molitor]
MSFEEASMTCSCLRSVFPGGYAESRSIKDPIRDRWENYHFLVSLSIPAYSDDTEQKLFACNGLVQSTDILITSKTCVRMNPNAIYNDDCSVTEAEVCES